MNQYLRHSSNAGRRYNDTASIHHAAVKLATEGSSPAGAKLGRSTSEAKTDAAQANGEKGGRPKGS